jgi:hypothetical protein
VGGKTLIPGEMFEADSTFFSEAGFCIIWVDGYCCMGGGVGGATLFGNGGILGFALTWLLFKVALEFWVFIFSTEELCWLCCATASLLKPYPISAV